MLYLSVEALVVSVGDVGDITLPENAVVLTASVDTQTETGILIFVYGPSRKRHIVLYLGHKSHALMFTLREPLHI